MSKHLGLSMRTIMIFFCNRRTRLATKGHFWCNFKVYHSDAYRKYLVWWIWVWSFNMRTIMIFFCNRRTRLATKGHFWCDFKVYHNDAYRKYIVWWIWVWCFNMLPRVIFDVISRYHSIYSSVTMVHSDMILSGKCIKSLFLIKINFYLAIFCLLAALFKVFLWVSH